MKAKEKQHIREITKMLRELDEKDLILVKHGTMALECRKQIEEESNEKNKS